NGEQACILYAEHRPDVVVMDVAMPGIGGFAAASRIRSRDPESRIVVLSAHDDVTSIKRMLDIGIMGYIAKSSATKILVEAIYKVAEGQKFLDPGISGRLGSGLSGTKADPFELLSDQEFEVFRLLALGHTIAASAKLLNLTPKRASTCNIHIMHKLGVSNVAQLAHVAIEHGIIDETDPKKRPLT
ncbi:MAG: response regulator transcription factor, partial [Gammaproteobacteria bacterium]|nr:response regulator transcription factor [Gammaproteobacteria bacterium]